MRIPESVRKEIKRLSARQHKPVSEIVRECLRRYVAGERFRELRGRVLPFAEAQGFLTDEDVFREIS